MKTIEKAKRQLIAHCFFTNGKVTYENYQKYYSKANNSTKKFLQKN